MAKPKPKPWIVAERAAVGLV